MTTSNTYSFTVTRDDLIKAAHQHIGLIGEGETPTTAQVTEAALLLNMLVKLRSADGMPLWALKRGYILPFTGSTSIATDSHVVTSYISTTLSGADDGNTTLTLTSTTGMTAGDRIGVETDSETLVWTTISSIDSATIVSVQAALGVAAASGNRVYSYTTTNRIQKPLRIIEANVIDVSTNFSVIVDIEDRTDYFALANKNITGLPNTLYYDLSSTSNTNLNNGSIYIYPLFADGDHVIEFSYHRPFQDFNSSTDNPDFPQAFYLPLMLELAALLGPKANLPIDERRSLFQEASMYLEQALSTVSPEGSLSLIPETR